MMKNILTTTTKTSLLLGITVLLFAGQAQATTQQECQAKGGNWLGASCSMPTPAQDCQAKGGIWQGMSCAMPKTKSILLSEPTRSQCGGSDQWSDVSQKCISADHACNEKGGRWTGASCDLTPAAHTETAHTETAHTETAHTETAEDCQSIRAVWRGESCDCRPGDVFDFGLGYCREMCTGDNEWSNKQQKCISAQDACLESGSIWNGVYCSLPPETDEQQCNARGGSWNGLSCIGGSATEQEYCIARGGKWPSEFVGEKCDLPLTEEEKAKQEKIGDCMEKAGVHYTLMQKCLQ